MSYKTLHEELIEAAVPLALIEIEEEIRLKLPMIVELEKLGVKLAIKNANGGWAIVSNPFDNGNLTAFIYIGDGPNHGYLMRFDNMAKKFKIPALSFWSLVRFFNPIFSYSNYEDILTYYAKKAGVVIPQYPKIKNKKPLFKKFFDSLFPVSPFYFSKKWKASYGKNKKD